MSLRPGQFSRITGPGLSGWAKQCTRAPLAVKSIRRYFYVVRYPPRLGHLATQAVLIAKLTPSYALAHRVDDDEAASVLSQALGGTLRDDLLESCWKSMFVGTAARQPREDALLEKVARSLKDAPLRPGRAKEADAALSAFWVRVGLEAGTASEAARRVFESERGRAMAEEGLQAAGRLLAAELTRK